MYQVEKRNLIGYPPNVGLSKETVKRTVEKLFKKYIQANWNCVKITQIRPEINKYLVNGVREPMKF